jgi:hypothetical protein
MGNESIFHFFHSSFPGLFHIGVSVGPGQTELTVMPFSAVSCAAEQVSDATAALLAQYDALYGEGLCDSWDAVLMTRP